MSQLKQEGVIKDEEIDMRLIPTLEKAYKKKNGRIEKRIDKDKKTTNSKIKIFVHKGDKTGIFDVSRQIMKPYLDFTERKTIDGIKLRTLDFIEPAVFQQFYFYLQHNRFKSKTLANLVSIWKLGDTMGLPKIQNAAMKEMWQLEEAGKITTKHRLDIVKNIYPTVVSPQYSCLGAFLLRTCIYKMPREEFYQNRHSFSREFLQNYAEWTLEGYAKKDTIIKYLKDEVKLESVAA